MAKGDKDKYTDKQKRQAEHIEESYEERGVSEEEAERRAWATVNAAHGGGEKPGGGGYGKKENKAPYRKGGKKGGQHRREMMNAECGTMNEKRFSVFS
jgi:plasmid stabilization system protein ParE